MIVRTCACALLTCIILNTTSVDGREPTPAEQLQLEWINRARANPNAEVTRLSGEEWGDDGMATPDLNEGLAPGTITNDPKQPLAFDLALIDAAGDYSELLLANNQFSHTWSGDPQGRMTAAGYTFASPFNWAENLALSFDLQPHVVDAGTAVQHHVNLFIDDDTAGRGHRLAIMNDGFRQIGIGMAESTMATYHPCCSNAVLTTQDYAASDAYPGPFLTGVVYNDLDMDSFYSIGEGLGSILVEVFLAGTEDFVANTITYGSGGYALEVAANTSYDVRFSGGGVLETIANVAVGAQNFKLDGINLTVIPEPGSALLLIAAGMIWPWRRERAEA